MDGDTYKLKTNHQQVVLLIFIYLQFKLIKSNIFCARIFIYYMKNYKCNIETIININFVVLKKNIYNFS